MYIYSMIFVSTSGKCVCLLIMNGDMQTSQLTRFGHMISGPFSRSHANYTSTQSHTFQPKSSL